MMPQDPPKFKSCLCMRSTREIVKALLFSG
uniref:Uncharacterized protein n=1 Tax=Rhizophora mucronata TaxID=61149 RepID=A0A2P2NLN1_RHIMU